MNGLAERADVSAGAARAPQQLRSAQRGAFGVVFGFDAIPAAFLAHMFAQQLAGFGIEQANEKTSTPSRRLSSTTMRGAPPSRRKAHSCNSAQMRELERKVSRRTDLRLQPRVITNSRVRRYLRLSGSRTMGPGP